MGSQFVHDLFIHGILFLFWLVEYTWDSLVMSWMPSPVSTQPIYYLLVGLKMSIQMENYWGFGDCNPQETSQQFLPIILRNLK